MYLFNFTSGDVQDSGDGLAYPQKFYFIHSMGRLNTDILSAL